MKHPTGYAQPRRLASPKKKPTRLDLRRNSGRTPDDEPEVEAKSTFWKWVGFVALLHVLVIGLTCFFFEFAPSTPPPENLISLLPSGDIVKGKPGPQEAPKIGHSTPAPSIQHVAPPPEPVPQPVAVQPKPAPAPPPTPVQPPPLVKTDVAPLVPEKPVVKTPPKVKVKIDLSQLVDGPAPDKPTKPKPHHKKPVAITKPDENAPDSDTASNPDSTGLSKEQIAAQLGEKLANAGATNAEKIGASGAANSHANSFSDFYDSIRDQAYDKWHHPQITDDMTDKTEAVVMIHVEKDGRVPAEQVSLSRSSGNSDFDASAIAAAKSLGYLYQPLPDGCSPDITINFKLSPQQ